MRVQYNNIINLNMLYCSGNAVCPDSRCRRTYIIMYTFTYTFSARVCGVRVNVYMIIKIKILHQSRRRAGRGRRAALT